AILDIDSGDTDQDAYAQALRRIRGQDLVIVSVYSSYAGRVEALEDLASFIDEVGRAKVPHVVVSFGNPYLITSFPDAQVYMLAWNGSEASQRAAVRALVGQAAIVGHVPTS